MKRTGSNLTSKQHRLGFLAGVLLGRGRKSKLTDDQLHQKEFKSSTQKIGIRFSERIRNTFRTCWLKIK
ncbi:MAG: hypothetical protein H8E62_03335 [Planctomycetes bacterium]|nr:hypothetical protein [Planctomycetota bacterium]